MTFDESGESNYLAKFAEFKDAFSLVKEKITWGIEEETIVEKTLDFGLKSVRWDPKSDPKANAVEWYHVDYEYAQPPVRPYTNNNCTLISDTLMPFCRSAVLSNSQWRIPYA